MSKLLSKFLIKTKFYFTTEECSSEDTETYDADFTRVHTIDATGQRENSSLVDDESMNIGKKS